MILGLTDSTRVGPPCPSNATIIYCSAFCFTLSSCPVLYDRPGIKQHVDNIANLVILSSWAIYLRPLQKLTEPSIYFQDVTLDKDLLLMLKLIS